MLVFADKSMVFSSHAQGFSSRESGSVDGLCHVEVPFAGSLLIYGNYYLRMAKLRRCDPSVSDIKKSLFK